MKKIESSRRRESRELSLHEQAAWIHQWNASRPPLALADIPKAKRFPILKGARS